MTLVLDAGALIALERADERLTSLLRRRGDRELVVPATVVAQVVRSARQAVVLRLLAKARVVPLDDEDARRVGLLLGASGTTDVVDAHVAVVARRLSAPVVTSDPDDLHRLDPRLVLHAL